MKTIGNTNHGGKIVEFSEEEYKSLVEATHAASGMPMDALWTHGDLRRTMLHEDSTNLFTALRAFCLAKFCVNDIRQCAYTLDKVLGMDKPKG